MKKILLASCIGLAFMNAPAFAYDYSYTETPETESSFSLGGVYVGANIGLSTSATCDDFDLNCMSWKGLLGYRSSETLAFEASYHNMFNDNSHVDGKQHDASALSLAVLKSTTIKDLDWMPDHKDLEVFGKAGVAVWKNELDSTTTTDNKIASDGTDFLLGAGAQMKMTDNIGLRSEIEYIGGDIGNTSYNAGITYSTF